MKKMIILFGSLLLIFPVTAQELKYMRLDSCYAVAERNHPLTGNTILLDKSLEQRIKEINTAWYPQLNLNAQASWQSDVTTVDIDMPEEIPFSIDFPDVSKDQYKLSADISQMIWDGGRLKAGKEAEKTAIAAEKQAVKVDLYGLRQRINDLYFHILLLQKQQDILELKKYSLRDRILELEHAVEAGVVLPENLKEMRAAMLSVKQQIIEKEADRKAARQILAELIGEEIPELAEFLIPAPDFEPTQDFARPELEYLNLQIQSLDARKSVVRKNRMPQLAAFSQLGYGRPGLNMLSDEFESFAIVGVRMSWKPWDWNRCEKQARQIGLQAARIQNQKQSLLKNWEQAALKEIENIEKFTTLLKSDEEIVSLRNDIAKSSESKLKNGQITSADYVENLNLKIQAEMNMELHQLLKAKAIVNYLTIKGNN